MDETPREPVLVWQLLRRHFVRIVIVSVLALAVYGMLTVWMPYQREQRIAKEIESQGGSVWFDYFGPDWMPQSVKDRLLYFNRIRHVRFIDQVVSAKSLSGLGSLSSLEQLLLFDTQVTDAGLENLKGLVRLEVLHLSGAQVTDAGLEHFQGLTSLKSLYLDNTQVTGDGLKNLKGLTGLKLLYLSNTQVTDSGLEHLKGLAGLEVLGLSGTQVTAEGRLMLRKALPSCEIQPEDD